MTSTFTVEIAIETEALASTLISAYEHGIYYWARDVDAVIPEGIDTSRLKEDFYGSDIAFALMTPGCAVMFEEHGDVHERGDGEMHTVTVEHLKVAIARLVKACPDHVETMLKGGDSNSGDCLWQFLVFPEIKYG